LVKRQGQLRVTVANALQGFRAQSDVDFQRVAKARLKGGEQVLGTREHCGKVI
jgi:hypothetical protein